MPKITWKPGTMLYPVPAVMVSCAEKPEKPNIITIAWTGTVCSDPPMLSISIRPERYSYGLIRDSGEFVVNVPSRSLTRATDWCGVKSGREYDKFREMSLTPIPGSIVKTAPLISEAPLNLECVVRKTIPLGSHDMFIGEIVAVHVDEHLVDEDGRLDLSKADLITYVHGQYWTLGKVIDKFGHSVRKKTGRLVKKPVKTSKR